MSRTPPPRTPEQQRAFDRVAALKIGTPQAVRAWAARYAVPLIHADDDDLLLISIHESRMEVCTGKRWAESVAWLNANKARIVAEHEAAAQAARRQS
jgi:hypothetical protein